MARRRRSSPHLGRDYGDDAPVPQRRRINGPEAIDRYSRPQNHNHATSLSSGHHQQYANSGQPEAQATQTGGSGHEQEPRGVMQDRRANVTEPEPPQNPNQQLRSGRHEHARQAHYWNPDDAPSIELLEHIIPYIRAMCPRLGLREQGMLVYEVLQIKLPVSEETYLQESGNHSNSHHCLQMMFDSSRARDPDFLPSINNLIREFRERRLDEADLESIANIFAKYSECCAFLQCHFLHSKYAYKRMVGDV